MQKVEVGVRSMGFSGLKQPCVPVALLLGVETGRSLHLWTCVGCEILQYVNDLNLYKYKP